MNNTRLLIITDLEGVNGVLNFEDWCVPEGKRNEAGCRFLTEEVNAALDGFFEGGFTEIVVWDGHGSGGSLRGELLDGRAALQRGTVDWPAFSSNYGALAFVGQHAKAGASCAHLAHTQTEEAIDFRLNGLSIGEYGQQVLAALEIGTTTIFVSGDTAMVREAAELTPGVIGVAVKAGLNKAVAAETPAERLFSAESAAIHFPRRQVLEALYSGALKAAELFLSDPGVFEMPRLTSPFVAEAEYRAVSPKLAALFGELPPRSIRTNRRATATEAIREFYTELEWSQPDGDRIRIEDK